MLPRSIQIVVGLVIFLAGASGVRGLIAWWDILDNSPLVAEAKSSIDIQFVDMMPENFHNFRATKCTLVALISNSTQHYINDLSVRIGNNEFRIGKMATKEKLDRWNVGSIELRNINSSCADQALYISSNIEHVSPWACLADGLSEAQCRSLVRISTRMGSDTIARIRSDEFDMGRRNVDLIARIIRQEISYITDEIDNRKVASGTEAGVMTNDVVVLHDALTLYYISQGPQAGWHTVVYEKCARLSILNKGGLAAFNASIAQRDDAYPVIAPGLVWYAWPTPGSFAHGQVRFADIAPVDFVEKCDAATGVVELVVPVTHPDGTPRLVK